jgi:hypothetical protein
MLRDQDPFLSELSKVFAIVDGPLKLFLSVESDFYPFADCRPFPHEIAGEIFDRSAQRLDASSGYRPVAGSPASCSWLSILPRSNSSLPSSVNARSYRSSPWLRPRVSFCSICGGSR